MGDGFFLEVKRPERGFNHSPTFSAEVKEKVELYPYSCLPSWQVKGGTLLLLYNYVINMKLRLCLSAPTKHAINMCRRQKDIDPLRVGFRLQAFNPHEKGCTYTPV
jgi:hypothetical protein